MENYSLKTMEAYSKIVELTGDRHHSQMCGEREVYWTTSIKDCDFIDLMVTLDEVDGTTIIEIIELIKDEGSPYKAIDYDSIYTLLGYASVHSIETKYNDHLKNDEDRSEVEI